MLCELSIKNFAIIDDLKILFSEGLTILSGETGAGKSIIINAVNLLLGSRATPKLIRTGAETAELEAFFNIKPGSETARIMAAQDYDPSEGLLIRRIISRNDRHRTYINGRIATIHQLNTITENLASISGQHVHQQLLKEDQHLLIIDQLGGLIPMRGKIYKCFHEMLPLIRKLDKLKALQERQTEHMALLAFQKNEIEAAGLTPGEDTTLAQEQVRLKNAAMLYESVHSSIEELYQAQGAIAERLSEIGKTLQKAGRIDPQLASKADGIDDITFRVEDLAQGLRNYQDHIQIDDNRLAEVEERLDVLNRLKRKYGGSLEAVFEFHESVDHDLSEIENLTDAITESEKRLSQYHTEISRLSLELSRKRKKAAEKIAHKIEAELETLKMPGTKLQISLNSLPADENNNPFLSTDGKTITETGVDRAAFLIAPNVGEDLKPMAQIASGGELSRVVLALKAIMAGSGSVDTIVFDEVDAGIGGGVAEVVGKKLMHLSGYHQVICITHLPQIAKFGKHHFQISKQVSDGRTSTAIMPLDEKERIKEIARMLGGEQITPATLKHAREMIKNT